MKICEVVRRSCLEIMVLVFCLLFCKWIFLINLLVLNFLYRKWLFCNLLLNSVFFFNFVCIFFLINFYSLVIIFLCVLWKCVLVWCLLVKKRKCNCLKWGVLYCSWFFILNFFLFEILWKGVKIFFRKD